MFVIDVAGPWWDVQAEMADADTKERYAYRDLRRCPQFLHDIGSISYQNIVGGAHREFPPKPNVGIWRVWATAEQLAKFQANSRYVILSRGETLRAFERPEQWESVTIERANLEAVGVPAKEADAVDAHVSCRVKTREMAEWCKRTMVADSQKERGSAAVRDD